jgi:hypothetical protein
MKERWKKERIVGRWEQERKNYLKGIGVELEGEVELVEEELEYKEKSKQRYEGMEKMSGIR